MIVEQHGTKLLNSGTRMSTSGLHAEDVVRVLAVQKLIVLTDHNVLHGLLTNNAPSGRMRWRLRLAELDFGIHHKLGKVNQQADVLSRLRTDAETVNHIDDDNIPVVLVDVTTDKTNTNIVKHNFIDLGNHIMDEVYATPEPPNLQDTRLTATELDKLVSTQMHDRFCTDILFRLNKREALAFKIDNEGLLDQNAKARPQIVVSDVFKQSVLYITNYTKFASHTGGWKLHHSSRRHLSCPAMAVDCYATACRCPQWARSRIKLQKNVEQLQLFLATAPVQSVSIYILGMFIRTKRGNHFLPDITNMFLKMVKTNPMQGIYAAEVTRYFVHQWVFNFGSPVDFLADDRGTFTAKFFQDVCKLMNIHKNYTTT